MSYDVALVSSDWHRRPETPIAYKDLRFLEMAAEMNVPAIINDDLLDLIIFGIDQYSDSIVVRSLQESIPPKGVFLTLGNHSVRLSWLRRLFKDNPEVRIARAWDLEIGGQLWHFEHGDKFAVDWGPLGPLYTAIAETFLYVNPKLWYGISKQCGWVTSTYRTKANDNGGIRESQRYALATWAIWARAVKYAINHQVNVAIGHTHQAVVLPVYQGLNTFQVADSGDFKEDGSYLIIDGTGARVEWL